MVVMVVVNAKRDRRSRQGCGRLRNMLDAVGDEQGFEFRQLTPKAALVHPTPA